MSDTDEPDKKPPPQRTVAWNPDDVPGLDDTPAGPASPPQTPSTPASEPTQRMPPRPPAAEPGATVRFPQGDPTGTVRPPQGEPAGTVKLPAGQSAGTVKLPPQDAGATVKFSPEEVARLIEEEAAAVQQADAEEDRLIGTLLRDKWKVLKKLGAGSFGTVYKVQDVTGGWIEALKILGVDRLTGAEAEEMRARFLREAQIMKRLGKDSKHIVGLSTYEEDIESGLIYFLMEFVEGRSLADALSDDGPFEVDRAVAIALQVCDALMAAHEGPEPVVHRDLKLENLMLTTDRSGGEIVKVLDFGIAKIAEREADSRLTTVGTLGTPGYAAPEQLRAEAVDGRTDLFAFGVIMYALLTGRDPWLGNLAHEPTHQIYELMVATDRAEVRPIAESGRSIPPAMVNIVMKLLRREPDQRFQSARELREALRRVEAGVAATDASSIRVLTAEPGVHVEVRDGRTLVAEGATPQTVEGMAAGTYTVEVRDPRYEATQTTVALGQGATQDVTLTVTRKESVQQARPRPVKKSRAGRLVAAIVVLAAGGATAWAQPWGRTLELDGLLGQVRTGMVTDVWLTEGGIEGGIQVVPVEALADLRTPFFVALEAGEIPDAVRRLRDAGAQVDVTWETARLTALARDAQARNRYFGFDGGDVRTYALRLAELVPDSPEAASLMLKVGERMAWDAEAALAEGPPEAARDLVDRCLALVADHPRCLELSGRL